MQSAPNWHANNFRFTANLLVIAVILLSFTFAACSKGDKVNDPNPPTPPVEVPKVSISKILPAHGYYGDSVLIEGHHFKADDQIFFNGIAVSKIMETDATHVKVIIPEGALSGPVQILQDKDTVSSVDSFTVNHHIYIGGDDYTFGYAAYWMDGQEIICNQVEDTWTAGLALSGFDVYLGGQEGNLIRYWQSGKEHIVPSDAKVPVDIRGLFVKDKDVYLVGNSSDYYGNTATYWKNGQRVQLRPENPNSSFGNAVFVQGSDVYVGGLLGESGPAYWKNGAVVPLSGPAQYPGVTSLFVKGDDVYVAGYGSKVARYWKNGEVVNLTSPDTCSAEATSIFVQGDDVYVSGREVSYTAGNRAVYWKNGVTHILLEGSEFAKANNICIVDGKVYVAGMVDYYSPAYWIDGKMERVTSLGHVTGFAVR